MRILNLFLFGAVFAFSLDFFVHATESAEKKVRKLQRVSRLISYEKFQLSIAMMDWESARHSTAA